VQIVSERLQFYAATQMTAYNNFFEDVKEQRETMGNGGAKIIFNNRVNIYLDNGKWAPKPRFYILWNYTATLMPRLQAIDRFG